MPGEESEKWHPGHGRLGQLTECEHVQGPLRIARKRLSRQGQLASQVWGVDVLACHPGAVTMGSCDMQKAALGCLATCSRLPVTPVTVKDLVPLSPARDTYKTCQASRLSWSGSSVADWGSGGYNSGTNAANPSSGIAGSHTGTGDPANSHILHQRALSELMQPAAMQPEAHTAMSDLQSHV